MDAFAITCEFIAALAFTSDEEVEAGVPRAFRSLDDMVDADEQLGLSVVESYDYETEDDITSTWTPQLEAARQPTAEPQANCYWTSSGHNPVIFSEAEVADSKRSAGGFSDVEPEYIPSFYSAAKPDCREQFRNYNTVTVWIHQNRDNAEKLQAGWKKFWRRYFAMKSAGTVSNWLMPWHVTRIKAAFNRAGITSQSK